MQEPGQGETAGGEGAGEGAGSHPLEIAQEFWERLPEVILPQLSAAEANEFFSTGQLPAEWLAQLPPHAQENAYAWLHHIGSVGAPPLRFSWARHTGPDAQMAFLLNGILNAGNLMQQPYPFALPEGDDGAGPGPREPLEVDKGPGTPPHSDDEEPSSLS